MRLGSLRVAGSPAVALELLPAVVTAFIRDHPGVDVTLLTHSATTVVDLVAAGHCDIGFVAEAIPHPAVRLERLTDAPMRCIVPLGHRLAKNSVLRPEDLRNEPFVSFPRSFDARNVIDQVFVEHDVHRQLIVEAQLSQTIVSLVANGAGVALIDPVTAAYARKRVAVQRFQPDIKDQIYLASATAGSASGRATVFADSTRVALKHALKVEVGRSSSRRC
jgi:DNA-binding transcriptional LysR family regulator